MLEAVLGVSLYIRLHVCVCVRGSHLVSGTNSEIEGLTKVGLTIGKSGTDNRKEWD